MSLKKKIVLSMFVGALIVAILASFLYLNFVEIKKEIVFLELTDTIRSKSLQLRRHEKNYFLYAPKKADDESKAIYDYLGQLDDIVKVIRNDKTDRTSSLEGLIKEYRIRFSNIERLVAAVSEESENFKKTSQGYRHVSKMVEANFLDKPLEVSSYLGEIFLLRPENVLIRGMRELDAEINSLRKTGENILAVSKDLDRAARENVDNFIRMSRIAILVFFPLFLITGFGTVLFITGNVVRKLQLLADFVEKAGHGDFTHVPLADKNWSSGDEVETLIRKFNIMEEQLSQREKELIQSKKLAAIGTLASGVAHELNNPLNNIYTTAQRLIRKQANDIPPQIRKGLDDIFGQTMRVKTIVSDLLEFARGREPHLTAVELKSLLAGSFSRIGNTRETGDIDFKISMQPDEIVLYADAEQLEQVLINLFSNAVDAMSGHGVLSVHADESDSSVLIKVTDTGPGISKDTLEKLFEPFFTTKERGTGLGLAIVFNIIQKHHGEISVESREGNGTSFIIMLPKKPVV